MRRKNFEGIKTSDIKTLGFIIIIYALLLFLILIKSLKNFNKNQRKLLLLIKISKIVFLSNLKIKFCTV